MYTKLLILLLVIIFYPLNANAIQVDENVNFQTSNTSTNYYIATTFNCTNINVYPTSLNINDGNITTYSNINMSMENLMNTTHLKFTNNNTITNLTIDNGFANFVINNVYYGLFNQSNNYLEKQYLSQSEQIYFEDIYSNSWFILSSSNIEMTESLSSTNIAKSTPITLSSTFNGNVTNVIVRLLNQNYTMIDNSGIWRYTFIQNTTGNYNINKYYLTISGCVVEIDSNIRFTVSDTTGGSGRYIEDINDTIFDDIVSKKSDTNMQVVFFILMIICLIIVVKIRND